MTTRVLIILAASLFLLPNFAAARDASAPPGADTPPSAGSGTAPAPHEAPGGSGTAGTTPQTCTDSCNRSYDVCMDQESAIPGSQDATRFSNNITNQLIGTSADCADHLRTCLNGCGG